jgi:hypothetical protein
MFFTIFDLLCEGGKPSNLFNKIEEKQSHTSLVLERSDLTEPEFRIITN